MYCMVFNFLSTAMSMAITSKFNQFLIGKNNYRPVSHKNANNSHHRQGCGDLMVIDLQSGSQILEVKREERSFTLQKNNLDHNNSLKIQIQLTQDSDKFCNKKLSGVEQQLKKKQQKIKENQNTGLWSSSSSPEEAGNQEQQQINYQAQLPRFRMISQQILNRKQALLRRNVLSWQEVQKMGKKQRKEVRKFQG